MIAEAQTPTASLDLTALRLFLVRQSDIIAAYLFGSRAENVAQPASDVDIALLLARDHTADSLDNLAREMELRQRIEDLIVGEADVVFLNAASPLLRFQVLTTGLLITDNDPDARIEFEVRASQHYFDLKPMYDLQTEELFRRLQEGRFGE